MSKAREPMGQLTSTVSRRSRLPFRRRSIWGFETRLGTYLPKVPPTLGYFCCPPPSEFIAVTSWGGWRIMRHVLLPRLWTQALQSVQARRSASSPRAPLISTLRWMEVSAKPGPWRLTLVSIQPFCSQSHIILSRHETGASPDRAGLQPTAHSCSNIWGKKNRDTPSVFQDNTAEKSGQATEALGMQKVTTP
ncbi:hypothetical protein VTG60DRAFT_5184 [Thermothelomyces hinnuleus]